VKAHHKIVYLLVGVNMEEPSSYLIDFRKARFATLETAVAHTNYSEISLPYTGDRLLYGRVSIDSNIMTIPRLAPSSFDPPTRTA